LCDRVGKKSLNRKSEENVAYRVGISENWADALYFGHGIMFGLESTRPPELSGASAVYRCVAGFQVSAAFGGGGSSIVATLPAEYMGGTVGVSLV
jgi:hypothetical protein